MIDRQIILHYDGHAYDVTHFMHPGDGICGVYLEEYHLKEISNELDHYHFTDEPYEILIKAKELGEYDDVKYLGEIDSDETSDDENTSESR